MSSRKKLTAEKLVDFLSAALGDDNPSKAALVALAAGRARHVHVQTTCSYALATLHSSLACAKSVCFVFFSTSLVIKRREGHLSTFGVGAVCVVVCFFCLNRKRLRRIERGLRVQGNAPLARGIEGQPARTAPDAKEGW